MSPRAPRRPSPADELLIDDTIARYNRAIHTGDLDEFLSLFTEDATWDSPLEGVKTGHAALGAWFTAYSESESEFHGGQHWVTNRLYDEITEDRVAIWSTWFFLTPNGDAGPRITVMGEYHDVLVKQDGRWRFERRTIKIPGVNA